ncbi:MAG: CAP domain-containing protein [Gemmatimonadota bacterium]
MRPNNRVTAAFALALAGSLAACGSAVAPARPAADPIAALVTRVNEYRSSIGCPGLRWHGPLSEVAQRHSEDMVQRDFFGHVNPDGESPFDRMRRAGIRWNGPAAENLAAFIERPETVLQRWLESPGHRANLEDCRYRHHAIGLSEGRWTHLLLSRPEN